MILLVAGITMLKRGSNRKNFALAVSTFLLTVSKLKKCSIDYFQRSILSTIENNRLNINYIIHYPLKLTSSGSAFFFYLQHCKHLFHGVFHTGWAAIEKDNIAFTKLCKVLNGFCPHTKQDYIGIKVGLL